MLNGDVQILDDFGIFRNLVNQLIVKLVGIQIVQADPDNALDFRELSAELGKAPVPVQVRAVTGDILGNHNKLLHTVLRQILRLLQDVLHLSGAVSAPDIGDGTEGAEVVAALRNAQVGPGGPGGDHTGDLIHGGAVVGKGAKGSLFQHGLRRRDNIGVAANAEHRVNLRQLPLDGILIPLRKAAGHNDGAERAAFFQLSRLQDGVNGLGLGRVDKTAGVDNGNVRPVRVRNQSKPGLRHQIEHLLAVYQVFGTAERYECKCMFHKGSSESVFHSFNSGANLIPAEASSGESG